MFPEFARIIYRNCYMNKDMCIDVLRRLRGAIRKKRPEKWRMNGWFLLHENAPAHLSVFIETFWAKNNVTNSTAFQVFS
jgi:hypothetical protein